MLVAAVTNIDSVKSNLLVRKVERMVQNITVLQNSVICNQFTTVQCSVLLTCEVYTGGRKAAKLDS